jgi:glycosyltransferase involved in cell wall biosynthesis
VHDDELRRELVARGSRRVEQYSWPHIASRFVDLYRSLA